MLPGIMFDLRKTRPAKQSTAINEKYKKINKKKLSRQT